MVWTRTRNTMRGLISEMAAGKAIIVSTHILEEVEAVCSRAVIIARGQLLADGTPEDLVARAPNHNAVAVSVASEDVQSAAQMAKALTGVQSVEILEAPDGGARLRVQPKNGSVFALWRCFKSR